MRAIRLYVIIVDGYPQTEQSIKVISAKSTKSMTDYNVTFASVGKWTAAIQMDQMYSTEPFRLYYCLRRLKHRDALKGHMLRHVQGPQKCSICGHISPNRKALGKHKHVHDPGRKERFRCTTCGKTCRDKLSLQVLVPANHSFFHSIQWTIAFSLTFRSILTSIPDSRAHIIAKIAAEYFDSAHHFVCTRRKCIPNRNEIRKFTLYILSILHEAWHEQCSILNTRHNK